ncbi:MAG: UDP-N-acetylenolpyruvoylglucosamine reductase [Candidatus Ryanbacteria bacterium CG10_big_fil_rev_8_21_14_0_10_43_42]|uniref:UDP-N-acetylenolpyruvoylglucosamine reductase n=1 Tax=Candidatus Ryanbacteria bacterium CG10_big_fil_rev_8_21_14_0_10_43_42 TaxID=1974864 RepID=A0A2M8KXG3_9BACT|nr:MAG: UDP-N-acetylenolpyruvoylglucosamine reductase [Candidatus Ryanbacteria bacterium CG10_big_fil_rev_8_21_14_0_10_43_42]
MEIQIQENVPLAPYTYLNIGGLARFFVEAKKEKDILNALIWAKENDMPYYIIGAGSNILVADKGFAGLVIKISLHDISFGVNGMCINAGVPMALAAARSVAEGYIGFEWAMGVPGTVGGSVYGNAGCFGGEMKDVVKAVRVLEQQEEGFKKRIFTNEECKFGYRESFFKKHPEIIILSVDMQLKEGTPEEINTARLHMRSSAQARVQEQDIGVRTAGSTFKGIPITDSTEKRMYTYGPKWQRGENTCWVHESRRGMFGAGFFIEQSGLKGMRIGGVSVSEKHANFMVNTGTATAEDVVMLIAVIKERVHSMCGIMLEEEIRYVGF